MGIDIPCLGVSIPISIWRNMMGYTHYFTQKKQPSTEQWQALKEKVIRVFNVMRTTPADRFRVCDGSGEITLYQAQDLFIEQGQSICFNGATKLGLDHETFYLTQKCNKNFEFCKTARKPYDFLVVAVLILADYYCPNCYNISSDGSKDDWHPVSEWLAKYLLKAYPLPKNI